MIGKIYLGRLQDDLPVVTSIDGSFVRIGKNDLAPKLYLDRMYPPVITNGKIEHFHLKIVPSGNNTLMFLTEEKLPYRRDEILLITQGSLVNFQAEWLIKNYLEYYNLFILTPSNFVKIRKGNSLIFLKNSGGGKIEAQEY